MRNHWCFAVLALVLAAALAQAQVPGGAGEIAAVVTDEAGKPLVDAVVIAVPTDGSVRSPGRPRDEIDQVDKEFTPRVKVVLVGSTVTFPNNDNVRHQVYSFSPAKRFELPLYAGVPPEPVVFDKPGLIVLGCNIHDWMVGYIYVSESPYFAKTGVDGRAVLTDLPPRSYVLRVWHPQLDATEESTRKTVDVARGKRTEAGWTLKTKAVAKIRRAPMAGGGGRY
jgi:plastocyanin